MARSRNIKPGIMTNDVLAELPATDRLLFIYLWMLADREGRLEDRPRKIKAEALPYDDLDIDESLNRLSKAGFIIRYMDHGEGFVQICNPSHWIGVAKDHWKETAYSAARRARKRRAIPAWADREAMRAIYARAKEISEATGILHHVDHIVPLQHRLVCGLHVPANLQILEATENVRKSNKFEVMNG